MPFCNAYYLVGRVGGDWAVRKPRPISIAFRFSVCPGKEATIFDRPPLNPLPLGGEEVPDVQ